MNILFSYLKRGILISCVFLIFIPLLQASNESFVLENANVLNKKVILKIEEMGRELYAKTRISVYASAPKTLNGKNIHEYENSISQSLKRPYVLFVLAKNEQQVDILNSNSLNKLFDKEQILSPYPWSGTVLPILAEKKENDKYNAATINGYADIVEQIANSKNIKLQSAIGSTNKNIYNYLKIAIYGFVAFILFSVVYRKMRNKND